MQYALFKIIHEYETLNICANPKAYINQTKVAGGGGENPHISYESKI